MADPFQEYELNQAIRNTYNPTAFDRLIKARETQKQRAEQASFDAATLLRKQANIAEEQRKSMLGKLDVLTGGTLGLDTDVARTLIGSVNTGTGAAIEGLGYAAERAGADTVGSALQDFGASATELGESFLDTRNVPTQGLIERSTPTGNILNPNDPNESFSLGEDPTVAGYGYQLLGILGEFAPQALGLFASGPVGTAIAATVGASQAGISQGKEAEKYILSLDIADLEKTEPYNKLITEENLSPEQAQKQLAAVAKATAFAVGGAIGGASGALFNTILKPLPGIANKGLLRKAFVKQAGKGFLEEGTAEAAESILSRAAANALTGTNRNIGEGSFGDFLLGGTFGGGLGGVAGGARDLADRAETKQKEYVKDVLEDVKQNKTISEAVAENNIEELINPENREKYPVTKVVAALQEVLIDEKSTPEQSQEAVEGLAKIQIEVKEKLQEKQAQLKTVTESIQDEQSTIDAGTEALETAPEENIPTIRDLIQTAKDTVESIQTRFNTKDLRREVTELSDQLNSIGELRKQNTAELDRKQNNDVETLVSKTESIESSVGDIESATEELITKSVVDPEQVGIETLQTLASNPQIPAATKARIEELVESRFAENELKTKEIVQQNIFRDDVENTGYKSIANYRSEIGAALQAKKVDTAKSTLNELRKFYNRHTNKLKAIRIAGNAVRKEAAVPTSKGKARQRIVQPNKDGSWSTTIQKGRLAKVAESSIKSKGGVFVSTGTADSLEAYIAQEVKVLGNTFKELQNVVNKKAPATATTKPKTTVTPAQAIKSLQKQIEDSGDTGIIYSDLIEFVDTHGSRTNQALLSKLIELDDIKNIKVTKGNIKPRKDTKGNLYTPVGLYSKYTNVINIDPSNLKGLNQLTLNYLVETIIHEGIHAATFDLIENDSEFQAEITKTSDQIQTWLNQEGNPQKLDNLSLIEYALRDPHELLTVALSHPEARRDLIKITGEEFAGGNALSELMQKIKDALVKALKLTTVESNALDAVLRLADQVLEPVTAPESTSTATETETAPETPVTEETTTEAVTEPDNVVPFEQPPVAATETEETEDFEIDFEDTNQDLGEVQDFLNNQEVSETTATEEGEAAQEAADQAEREANLTKFPEVEVRKIKKGESIFSWQKKNQDLDPDTKASPPIVNSFLNEEQAKSVNKLTEFFNVKNTPLSSVLNFVEGVVAKAQYDIEVLTPYVRGGKERIDAFVRKGSPYAFLKMYMFHQNKWTDTLDVIHKLPKDPSKHKNLGYKHPSYYFVDPATNKLDSVTKNAIIYGAVNFIVRTGNSMYYNITDTEVRTALNLPDDAEIDAHQAEIVRDAGRRFSSVVQEVGTEIYNAIGLQLKPNIGKNEKAQMVGALGSLGVGLLQKEGYIQKIGIAQKYLLNAGSDTESLSGFETAFFLRSNLPVLPNGQTRNNKKLSRISEVSAKNGNFLNDVFNTAYVKKIPTLKPVKSRQTKPRAANSGIGKNQLDYVNKQNAKPYYLQEELLGETGILQRLDRDIVETISGVVPITEDGTQVNLIKALDGKNKGIQRELDILFTDTAEDLLDNDLSKPLYLQHDIKKQGRVHPDSSGFNPQSSKIHRWVMTIGPAWKYTVNLDTGKNVETFKLAVLEALGYKTDIATPETVLKNFSKLSETPEFVAALPVLQNLITDKTYQVKAGSPEAKLISDAVRVGGENMHSFVGLLAWAQYTLAPFGSFETSLGREGDGKTNGPMLNKIQLGLTGRESDVPFMELGGFFTEESEFTTIGEFAEVNKTDLYKEVSKNLVRIVNDFDPNYQEIQRGKYKQKVLNIGKKYKLVKSIIGELTEENTLDIVTSVGRALSKAPVTKQVYGEGVKKTIEGMSEELLKSVFLTSIYERIQKLKDNPQETSRLIDNLNDIIYKKEHKIPKNKDNNYLQLTLTTAQEEFLKGAMLDTVGLAVEQEVKSRFATTKATSDALNVINNITAEMYIAVWNARKAQIIQDSIEAQGGDFFKYNIDKTPYVPDLSAEQEAGLREELKEMLPIVNTPLSLESGDFRNGYSLLREKRATPTESEAYGGYKVITPFKDLPLNTVDAKGKSVVRQQSTFTGSLVLEGPPAGAAIVGLTQSIDIGIAQPVIADEDILNIHDAGLGSAEVMARVMQKYNKRTLEVSTNYSIPLEVMKAYYRVADQFFDIAENFTNDESFSEAYNLIDEKLSGIDSQLQIPVLPVAMTAANRAHKQRLEFIAKLKYVDQYSVAGGNIEVTEEQRTAAKEEALKDFYELVDEDRDPAAIANDPFSLKKQTAEELEIAKLEAVVDADTQEKAAPPFDRGPLEYTTEDVFTALNETDPITKPRESYVKDLLANIVNQLHESPAASKTLLRATMGETPVELFAKNVADNAVPFFSKTRLTDIELTDAEGFVLEQVELIVKESFNAGSTTDKEIVKIFKEAKLKLNSDGRNFHKGDWNTATPDEKAKAKNIYNFIFDINTTVPNSNSDILSRFVALGLVYEPLSTALNFSMDAVASPTSNKIGDRLQAIFNRLMQWISDHLNNIRPTETADVRLKRLAENLVRHERKQQIQLQARPDTVLEEIEKNISRTASATVSSAVNANFIKNNRSSVVRATGKVVDAIAQDRADQLFKKLEESRNFQFRNKRFGLLAAISNEFRGEQPDTVSIYNYLRAAKKIEQERKTLSDVISKDILDQFANADSITDEQKAGISQLVLRTDLAALLDNYTVPEIVNLVLDSQARTARIDALANQILLESPGTLGNTYIEDSLALAYFMATGENKSRHLLKNAHNIVRQLGVSNSSPEQIQQGIAVESLVDELISLKALDYTEPRHLAATRSLLQSETARGDQSGIDLVLTTHKRLKEEALTRLFNDNPVQMQKGYVRESYNPHNTVVAATAAEGRRLLRDGYEELPDLPQDLADPKLGERKKLYGLKGIGLQSYETAALSFSGMRASGTLVNSNSTANNPQALFASKKREVFAVYQKKMNQLNGPQSARGRLGINWNPRRAVSGNLAPVLDPEGNVSNYQYLMTHNTKNKIMDRDNSFESILGGTAANQYDKKAGKEHNANVVTGLHDFYRAEYAKDPNAWVKLSEDSPDPILRNAYRLLPESTKIAIRDTWGANRMYVRNDLVDTITGYRNLSISDPFGKDPNMRNMGEQFLVYAIGNMLGPKAATRIRRAEDMWRETVKLVKDIVVVRNLWTLVNNIVSNGTLLFLAGVPLKNMARDHWVATEGLLKYQKDMDALLVLKNRIGSNTNQAVLNTKIKELEFEIKRNPVSELIEAGLFSSIVEDIDIEKADPRYKSDFNRIIDTQLDRLPGAVRKAGNIAFVGKETSLYKILAKGTQMSDFVARYALYNHLKTRRNNPLSGDELISKVSETFVNYDIPTHRFLQYMNNVGLIMFTKYYIRSQKVIASYVKSNPSRGLALAMADNYIDSLQSILDTSFVSRGFGNPLDIGAAAIFGVLDEPLPMQVLFK